MKKIAVFAFQGELMCFAHALLNTLDLAQKGHEVCLILEGASVKLITELASNNNPFHQAYQETINKGLLAGICQACANKMGTLEEAKTQGLSLLNDMKGHPSMESYIEKGFEIITI